MSPAVITAGLTRRFGHRTAVDHLDLDIAGGEVFGLVGPNSAGKTTLIRILCAILRPSAGSARVLGLDVAADAARLRPLIGYMSQAFSLYQALTVTENLRFYGTLYGGVPARREQDVCRLVGLAPDELARKVAELPTGVRQRAALAAAVLHGPQLIFLDEPTSGVNPVGRRNFWALIRELSADGTTVIVTTHVMAEAGRCNRVALMAEGRMLACGPPRQPASRDWHDRRRHRSRPMAACLRRARRPVAGDNVAGNHDPRLSAGGRRPALAARRVAVHSPRRAHPRHRPVLRRRLHLVHQAQPPRH